MTQQGSNAADLIDEFRKRDESATRVIAEWKVCAEDAAARAKALQGEIDRCVAHIRNGQQMRADEPDAGLEALVVGWVKYHGDYCNFKARAERAEAQVRAVEEMQGPLNQLQMTWWSDYPCAEHEKEAARRTLVHQLVKGLSTALAAGLSLQEEQEPATQTSGALQRADDFAGASTDAERIAILTRGLPNGEEQE